MAKSMKPWVEVFDEIEATAASGPIDCRGYNALAVRVVLDEAKNWTLSILGSTGPEGPFTAITPIGGSALSHQTSVDAFIIFQGLPDYVQLKATEDADGAKLTAHYSVCLV